MTRNLILTCAVGAACIAAGCSEPRPSAWQGLESLSRVRLRVESIAQETGPTREALEGRAARQLHEELPQLDTSGPSDGWTLEIRLAWQYEQLSPQAQKMPDRWATCGIRVVKPAVVAGRHTVAVAYDGPISRLPGTDPRPDWMPVTDLGVALDRTIRAFAADWHKANPAPAGGNN